MKNVWIKAGKTAFWLSWPALFAYLYASKRTRIIIIYKGEVLLVKSWLGPGQWKLPGGGLHLGEDTIMGALREVEEETGIQLDPKEIKFLEKRRISESGLSSKLIIYTIELLKRPTLRPQKLELVDAKWLQIKDVLSRSDISKASKQLILTWQQLDQPVKMKAG